MQITFSERELEDFLCTGKNLEKYLDLKFIARQVNIPPVGIVDILAYSKDSSCFVIIELKRDLLDSSAFIQGLSYLRYYQEVRSFNLIHRKRSRRFALLLVGQNLSHDLIKVVSPAEYDCHFFNYAVYYKLFSVDFQKGVNFGYFLPPQKDYENKLLNTIGLLEYKASEHSSKK